MKRSHELFSALAAAFLFCACSGAEDSVEVQPAPPNATENAQADDEDPSPDGIDANSTSTETAASCLIGDIIYSTEDLTGLCCLRNSGVYWILKRSAWNPNYYLCY